MRHFDNVMKYSVTYSLLGLVGPSGSNQTLQQRALNGQCRSLMESHQDFLLDPYQRRAFNEVHGFLTPTVNVAWWSGCSVNPTDGLVLRKHAVDCQLTHYV